MTKLTWEDILPKYSNIKTDEFGREYVYDYGDRKEFIKILQQAEREGKVCLNPPSEDEILDIIISIKYELLKKGGNLIAYTFDSDSAKAISRRLRG